MMRGLVGVLPAFRVAPAALCAPAVPVAQPVVDVVP
jgi:hypothetical protein